MTIFNVEHFITQMVGEFLIHHTEEHVFRVFRRFVFAFTIDTGVHEEQRWKPRCTDSHDGKQMGCHHAVGVLAYDHQRLDSRSFLAQAE